MLCFHSVFYINAAELCLHLVKVREKAAFWIETWEEAARGRHFALTRWWVRTWWLRRIHITLSVSEIWRIKVGGNVLWKRFQVLEISGHLLRGAEEVRVKMREVLRQLPEQLCRLFSWKTRNKTRDEQVWNKPLQPPQTAASQTTAELQLSATLLPAGAKLGLQQRCKTGKLYTFYKT